ncbi:hypothetical protein HKCCE3408_15140 [Rhodobacterales bacterium HKCCE3408]|nr:hypothetical protein [Rhodobacterales bacterium HKCCE3408]
MLVLLGWTASPEQVDVIRSYRQAGPRKPILVVSRHADVALREQAFREGADNFVTPDHSELECVAKVRRLWNMASQWVENAPISVGALEIWPEHKVVLNEGKRVQLSRKEMDVLTFLAERHPRTVSRRVLEQKVFGLRNDPGTNVVAVHVHRLRKKISEKGDLLKTVPGGYKLGCVATYIASMFADLPGLI